MKRQLAALTLLLLPTACAKPFTFEGETDSSGDDSTSNTNDATDSGDTGTETDTAETGSTDDGTGEETDGTEGETGTGMDLPPDGPYNLCEGPWDSFIIVRQCEIDNCATEFVAVNPDGSGRTSLGFHSPAFQIGDPNPIDGRVLLTKATQQPGSSDVYVYDLFKETEGPLAQDSGIDEYAGEWSHQGNQASIVKVLPIMNGFEYRCYRILDTMTNYVEVEQNVAQEYPAGGCSWSPTADEVIYRSGSTGGTWRLKVNTPEMTEVLGGGDLFASGPGPRWSIEDEVAMSARLWVNGAIMQVWTMQPDGTGLQEITDFAEGITGGVDWSPDGTQLVVTEQEDVDPAPNIMQMVGVRVVTMDADGSNQNVILGDEGMSYSVVGWGGCPE